MSTVSPRGSKTGHWHQLGGHASWLWRPDTFANGIELLMGQSHRAVPERRAPIFFAQFRVGHSAIPSAGYYPKATRVLPRVSGKASAATTTIRYAPPAMRPIASPSGIVLLR